MQLNVEEPQVTGSTSLDEPRLLFVYDGEFDYDNGVSSYIRTIGDYATQQGCKVDYLVGKTSIEEPNVVSVSKTVPVQANGSRSLVAAHTPRRAIREVVDDLDPDAVHVQLPFVPFMAGKALKELSKDTTIVGTFHTPMPNGWLRAANRLNARLTRTEMKRFDHFYSVSEAAQQAAQQIYGVDTEILPCPINLYQPREGQRDQANDETVITFLGRLVARKGAANLIDSLKMLDPEMQRGLRLQIVGDGEERQSLERQIADSGLRDNTRFFGQVDESHKHELLAESDIVACTSNGSESFGIVLVEAMAAGRPVVLANDITGYSEVLRKAPASLVDHSNPASMSRRIEALIKNPAQQRALFEAQQAVVGQFDINKTVGPKLMQAYGFTSQKGAL